MTTHYTAFEGHLKLVTGSREQVLGCISARLQTHPEASIIVFEDTTGKQVELEQPPAPSRLPGGMKAEPLRRGRGRPKLGVIPREVTLLPRHWQWLREQPGGASAALRKLVDEARRGRSAEHTVRAARSAAYTFMTAIAGDLPGYEEAIRALFAGDRGAFEARIRGWPADIVHYATGLAEAALPPAAPPQASPSEPAPTAGGGGSSR